MLPPDNRKRSDEAAVKNMVKDYLGLLTEKYCDTDSIFHVVLLKYLLLLMILLFV